MEYLNKIYYKNNKNYYDIYKSRFNFETTLKVPLRIKPYGSNEYFQLYYVYNNDTSQFIDEIRQNDEYLNHLDQNLPRIAKNAFLVDVISSELKSTNDLEGVESNKEAIVETTKNLISNELKEDNQVRMSSMINSYLLLSKENQLKEPINPKDIRKIYDEITRSEIEKENLPDGNLFRKDVVYVSKKGSPNGEAIHQGIVGEKNIEEHISNLLSFIDDDRLPILIRVAIGHYYFGYIHPFYDGNGRVGRFISSLFINKEYNYLTAMSLSRGSIIKKVDYYKSFKEANSKIMMGEMNYFIDVFLKILIAGQRDIIENLLDKRHKLDTSDILIKQDKRLDSELKANLMFMLAQSYYFDANRGIMREVLINYAKEDNNAIFRIKKELKELEELGLIVAKKSRPLIYALDNNYFNDLLEYEENLGN